MTPCPDEERLAAAIRAPSGAESRERLLDHLADCSLCRRQAEILALPRRVRRPWAGAAAAAIVLACVALLSLPKRSRTFETPSRPAARHVLPAPVPKEPPREARRLPRPAPDEEGPRFALLSPPGLEPRLEEPRREALVEKPEKPARPEPLPDSEDVQSEDRRDAVAIVSPFGPLRSGKEKVASARRLAPSDSLIADGGVAGFRLVRGTRIALESGAVVRVFSSPEHLMPGLELREGTCVLYADGGLCLLRMFSGKTSAKVETRGSVVVERAKEGTRLTALHGEARCGFDTIREGETFVMETRARSRTDRARPEARFQHRAPPLPILFADFEADDPAWKAEKGRRAGGVLQSEEGRIEIRLARPIDWSKGVGVRFRCRASARRVSITAFPGDSLATRDVPASDPVAVSLETRPGARAESDTLLISVPASETLEIDDLEILEGKP
jgi:hypothetical protein